MRPSRHAQHGFTLAELLITLASACILAMIGAPAMGSLLASTQTANAEASIAASLHQARSAAVLRNVRILVCPSRDGHHCRPGDDWQHGWIVVQDTDRDNQPDPNAGIIATQLAVSAGMRIVTSAGRGQVAFHPDGSAAGSNARFTICNTRVHMGKSVIVANSGRVRTADPDRDHLQQCLAGTP